jgi:hypothetical protein
VSNGIELETHVRQPPARRGGCRGKVAGAGERTGGEASVAEEGAAIHADNYAP